MSDSGLVLVVGSGGQQYREYLLRAASRRHRLWLLDPASPTWQADYVVGSTVVPLLDVARLIPDQQGLIAAALALAERFRVVGALTYDETLVITTAHINERLGLPGLTVAGAENCRNKQRTREMLTTAGIAQPRFAYVTDLQTARRAAAEIGYPVVVKPRGMGASIGVVRVDHPTDLAWGFSLAEAASHGGSPSYEGGVLVEEFLTGPEISVDGAVHAGEYEPFCLAHKRIGLVPFNEEIGHVVTGDDPLLSDPAIGEMLRHAHRVLGVQTGITHTEIKLTPHGPVIVEVNARLGGDLIPYLGQLASGVDPGRIAVDLALGRRPTIRPSHRRTVGVRFCYPPRDGVLRSVTLPSTGASLLEAAPMVQPGAPLHLPPAGYINRYAHLISTGSDAADCDALLDAAEAEVRLELVPEADRSCA